MYIGTLKISLNIFSSGEDKSTCNLWCYFLTLKFLAKRSAALFLHLTCFCWNGYLTPYVASSC